MFVGRGAVPLLIVTSDPSAQAATLPITTTDGKWHHVCVTWSTRDGAWEVYQDGVKKGYGQNLAPWHAIKAGGVFILGQEQVGRRLLLLLLLMFAPGPNAPVLLVLGLTGHDGGPLRHHSVLHGAVVGPPALVQGPDPQRGPPAGHLQQPPDG